MIHLVVVGSVRPPLAEAVAHYEERLAHYWKFSVDEVPAGLRSGSSADPDEVMKEEAARITARLPERADVWALAREGRGLSSSRLASLLEERRVHAAPPLALVIGGAWGLHPDLLGRASRRLRLSQMTPPHEMARLLLVEQLYRAGTILRNEPYHKARSPKAGGGA